MPEKNKELNHFLNNVKKGLKLYSVKELNKALTEVLNRKHDKNPEIQFIKQQVAYDYEISERVLIFSSGRGKIKEARKICSWLLHYDLGIPQRHIAQRIFGYKAHNLICVSIREFRTLSDKIKVDLELKERYIALQKKLIEFISSRYQK